MAMILFNPTNENLETQYIGERVLVKSDSKVRVDDPRGRHVLNTLGPRGLMTLEYGDEGEGEERKRKEGIERNLAFKKKQVIDFNTVNEQRFQSKLPYVNPSKQIREYAKELGIGLREPYNVEDEANKEISELRKKLGEAKAESKSKDSDISELKTQVAELSALMNQVLDKAGKAIEAENAEANKTELVGIKASYQNLNKKRFAPWVLSNWNLISQYPEEIQNHIAEKFSNLYKAVMPTIEEELEKMIAGNKLEGVSPTK